MLQVKHGCARGLALIERLKATWKWAIDPMHKWLPIKNSFELSTQTQGQLG